MRPTYVTAEVRQHEHQALIAHPEGCLMHRAGLAVATHVMAMLTSDATLATADLATPPSSPDTGTIVALAGPGNNGGDALRAAIELTSLGYRALVLLPMPIAPHATDAVAALSAARQAGVPIETEPAAMLGKIADAALIIDGLFGIGLTRPIAGLCAALIQAITRRQDAAPETQGGAHRCPVLAIDVPSGLDSDRGCVVGGVTGLAVRADVTVTMLVDKPGLHTATGAEHAGRVLLADLDCAPPAIQAAWGEDPPDSPSLLAPAAWLIERDIVGLALPPRRRASHKGDHGDLLLTGGAAGMTGAIMLSARAALHTGAGRIFFERLSGELQPDPLYPEMLTHAPSAPLPKGLSCLVMGPGMGTSTLSEQRFTDVITAIADTPSQRVPALVLDADALNLLAESPSRFGPLLQRVSHADVTGLALVLTPHPLEAARLLKSSVAAVESDRLAAARQLAHDWQAIVVLKGAGSIIAAPDGLCGINTSGNPGLATGGSGDVLSGILGALLANAVRRNAVAQTAGSTTTVSAATQPQPGWWHRYWAVVAAGVWLHGRAADRLVEQGDGPLGLTPSALAEHVRRELNLLVRPC